MLKRIMGWMLAILLTLCVGAGAETTEGEDRLYAVQLAESARLTDGEGRAVVEAGEYRLLYELSGTEEGLQLFAGEAADGEAAGYALLNGRGDRLTGFDYQVFEYAAGKILFMKNERWGVMDPEGNVLMEAAYTSLISNGAGGYLAQKTDPYDDSPDEVYYIGANYAEHGTGVKIVGGLYALSDGLMAAVSAENGLYGYLNAEGTWALPPVYRWAGAFEDGRAHVSTEHAGGLIDRDGNWVLKPEYGYISYEGMDSMIVATKGGEIHVIHPETLETAETYRADGAAGYALESGGAVISFADGAFFTGMDAETVRLDGCRGVNQWGGMTGRMIVHLGEFEAPSIYLYDLNGEAVAGPYRDIMPLGSRDGEMYYVFTSFEATKVEYGEGMTFWDEVPGTRICGVLAPDGKELCAFEAEYISYAGEGRMLIQQEGSAGFADFEGNIYAHIEEKAEEGGAE